MGTMTVEGHKTIQHSAQKALCAGAAKAAGNRVVLRGAAPPRTQRKLCGLDWAVKRLLYSCGLRARRECKRWHGMMGPSASCCP